MMFVQPHQDVAIPQADEVNSGQDPLVYPKVHYHSKIYFH